MLIARSKQVVESRGQTQREPSADLRSYYGHVDYEAAH